jgi:SAM-dependent methyltransferase
VLVNTEPYEYVGGELGIFSHARRWKTYWGAQVRNWISGDVLEVGAGLGANTVFLQTPEVRSWTCLEPDARLASSLKEATANLERVIILRGTTEALRGCQYDVILYIDVLEHIQDDRAEMERAAALLRTGGRIIVLAPAHQSLYSPFDAAIGHYRRYSRLALSARTPEGCRLETMRYLDCVGLITSSANCAFLRQRQPTLRQILFWDRVLIPLSRVLDPVFGFRLGKSVLSVWRR